MDVHIRILGDFAVELDGRPVARDVWTRRQAAALVKLLALTPQRELHREQVVDALWPDLPLADAVPRLHKAAHFARRALGHPDALVLASDAVRLFPEARVTVDAEEFADAAERALRDGTASAAADALARYGGDLLPHDIYEPWTEATRTHLGLQRLRLLRQAGRWDEVLALDPDDLDARAALLEELRAERPPAVDRGRLEQQIRFCRTADGVTLAYAVSGDGPPLVKVANWLTHLDHDWRSPVWRHWLESLSRRHRLVRYDERGCGLSDWEVEENSFAAWVHDLETVVDAAGLDRFALLGISQGGPVAVEYAARHPERVSKLVIYGSYAEGRRVRATDEEELRLDRIQIELARLGWGRDDPAFRQVFTTGFMPEGTKELWDAFNELQRLTTTPENAARVLEVTSAIDVRDVAPRVQAPTLVLHARRDHRPPFEQGRLLASLIPGARFVALESCNHILLEDEPAWPIFLDHVEAFLTEPGA